MAKNLPKSLHTVTVLVNVARLMAANHQAGVLPPEAAVERALRALGYAGCTDTYLLAEQAVRALIKETSK